MDMPTVAIVGRPNVGKSTLFNRLVGKKLALVDDRPGVTRDRREGDVAFGGLEFRVIDTAGLEEADAASLTGRMRMQTEAAILAADVVLFVIDARAGVLPADQPFAELVRRAGCPVILIANKAEGGAGLAGAYEAFTLGLGDPIPFSAEHGEGLGELHEALKGALPQRDADEDPDDAPGGRALKVAIVGRPNAGKSTLINRMLGEDRLLVGPEAGITRDSISLDWEWRGRRIKLHDTAGMRRRARIDDKLEKLAVSDGLRAVRFAEVVVVLLDATIPFEKQDLTIVDLVESEGRALVIGLNKWDLVADQPGLLKQLREDCTRLLPQVRGVAVVPLSGLAGDGVDKLMQAVVQAAEVWDRRVSTSRINDWLNEATSRNPPPAVSGRRIKIRYATQVKSRPPHFALFGNQLNALPKSYTRYLVNGLREAFDLPGTPIRLSLRTSQNPFDKG
ncbi:GTP-binding protein [Methylobacterium sp. PvP062]|uniref:GTPase Der n=2 Tax=Methylobacterium radiotolerans TaxID=31998 RepID=B1LY93_METRJ|nr:MULTISPECIES: ribosome biogenesis GTPase Der [Methylobacterium]MCX7330712.1 ribosome biogenesis GTPase Der [Hyphomicrobiales bacterium]ACB25864.1 small GTP-binding protein [Methylobacterium radiotolerans JCM 2831]KIU30665.1 GTP-binding protein Der [Methylobacterium radiotolerans]KTS07430.1 GTP-binding protein Der [Methylobacterium radiotolerans]KTS47698.1 GTP-binding protein Der [Methylobacterium radiotolerans]